MHERPRIFISFVREDEAHAQQLYNDLSRKGFEPWLKGAFQRGSTQQTNHSFSDSDFFLACLSNNSVNSEGRLNAGMRNDLSELWQQLGSSSFVVPVRLADCKIPEILQPFDSVDLFAEDGFAILLKIIDEVLDHRKQLLDAFPVTSAAPKPSSTLENETLEGPLDPNSRSDWGVDLRRLISGEREDIIERLGGVEEYVEVMLAEAGNAATAEQAFVEALEQLVQAWQPSTIDSELRTLHILDLISAYTPRAGFVKAIALLKNLRRFIDNRKDVYSIYDDIYLKSFVALENYYQAPPRPPEDQSPAYRTYIDLLMTDLSSPIYCGYALRRLVELGVVTLGRQDIERLIHVNPAGLTALLGFILDRSRQSENQGELSVVYSLCLEAGPDVEQYFEYAVNQCGGRMQRLEEGPQIEFRGARLLISLSELSRYRYLGIMFNREDAKGLKKLNTLTANA